MIAYYQNQNLTCMVRTFAPLRLCVTFFFLFIGFPNLRPFAFVFYTYSRLRIFPCVLSRLSRFSVLSAQICVHLRLIYLLRVHSRSLFASIRGSLSRL
jgi:hypothetical protein